MTRFWISIESAVQFIAESFEIMSGGELYVPRIPSMRLIDLVHAISPNSEILEIGIRPGEKLHEEMISADDSRRTVVLPGRFVVTPVAAEWGYVQPQGDLMPEGIAYRSDTNDMWMSEQDLKVFVAGIV
jgi:UDP-N-acetylglucosamine 4,6-dehydratase